MFAQKGALEGRSTRTHPRGAARTLAAVAPVDGAPGSTRVDKWLWGTRMYKTRGDATEACRAGHVKLNGASAKAAALVRPGDKIEALTPGGPRVLEVTTVIEKRTGAALARECYIDHTPPPPPQDAGVLNFAREAGTGRPTKRERRQMDRARRA